jgi:ankyrin repeat protein
MKFQEANRAIKRGKIKVIENAISDGLDANSSNKLGWALLMLTALEGNTNIGILLPDHGAKFEVPNAFGESALSLAAHKGHLPFVKLLKL